jgi:archaellum component FlaC
MSNNNDQQAEEPTAEQLQAELVESEALLEFITKSCNGLTEGVEELRKTLDMLRDTLEQVSGESIEETASQDV